MQSKKKLKYCKYIYAKYARPWYFIKYSLYSIYFTVPLEGKLCSWLWNSQNVVISEVSAYQLSLPTVCFQRDFNVNPNIYGPRMWQSCTLSYSVDTTEWFQTLFIIFKRYTNSSNLHVMIVLHTAFKEWSVYVWKWLFGTHQNVKTLATSFEKTVQVENWKLKTMYIETLEPWSHHAIKFEIWPLFFHVLVIC